MTVGITSVLEKMGSVVFKRPLGFLQETTEFYEIMILRRIALFCGVLSCRMSSLVGVNWTKGILSIIRCRVCIRITLNCILCSFSQLEIGKYWQHVICDCEQQTARYNSPKIRLDEAQTTYCPEHIAGFLKTFLEKHPLVSQK